VGPPTDLFNYLAIAFGLLYSVAALRVLGGLPGALVPDRRYGLHLGLTFDMLLLITISFWTFWSLREVRWTFPGFALALLVPGLLYYCAAVLVPENPERIGSWRDHYFAMRRRWYGGFGLWGLAAGLSATVNLDMALSHPARAIHAGAFLIGVAGFSTSSPRVHAVIVAMIGLLLVAGSFDPELGAGWLARP
jgi:hypothetical protein